MSDYLSDSIDASEVSSSDDDFDGYNINDELIAEQLGPTLRSLCIDTDDSDDDVEDETVMPEAAQSDEAERLNTKLRRPLSLLQLIDGIRRPVHENLMSELVETETYIISMDSLFAELCSHQFLDWTCGGQSLVLIAMAEKFLYSFHQKGGRFTAVWFSKLENVFRKDPDIFLPRQILKTHLRSIPEVAKSTKIFSDPTDTGWLQFIKEDSPALALISANAISINHEEKAPELKECLSGVIIQCLSRNIPVVDFAGMEENVSTFFAFRRRPIPLKFKYGYAAVMIAWKRILPPPDDHSFNVVKDIRPSSVLSFWTETLKLLKEHLLEEKAGFDTFAQKLILFAILSDRTGHCHQRQTNASEALLGEEEKELLQLAFYVAGTRLTVSFPNLPLLIDGRFLMSVSNFCDVTPDGGKVPEAVFSAFRGACAEIGVSRIWGEDSTTTVQLSTAEANSLTEPVTGLYQNKFNFPLFTKFVGREFATGSERRRQETSERFFENHHWHSGKLIEEEFGTKSRAESERNLTDWQRKGRLRGKQFLSRWFQFYGETLEGKENKFKVDFSRKMISPTEATGTAETSNGGKAKKNYSKKPKQPRNKDRMHAEIQGKRDKKEIEKEHRKLNTLLSDKAASNIVEKLRNAEQDFKYLDTKAQASFEVMLILRHSIMTENKRKVSVEQKRDWSVPLFGELKKLLTEYHSHLSEASRRKVASVWMELGFTAEEAGLFKEYAFSNSQLETGFQLEISCLQFQLGYAGEFFDVRADPQKDLRVQGFEPDRWQRDLLNVVDRKESALIVAPTSAGKTFISYYCIEKVLRDNDEGIVVYVSPTKALVNQVAATINARFSGKNLKEGQALLGTFTRDIRNNILNSHVLMTVPQCLEILLLSTSSTHKSWRRRIRYVIFDEVHCIGGGVGDILGAEVWEHIILLNQSPFLALSATIQNPEKLHSWLEEAERQKTTVSGRRREVALVTCSERYSELQPMLYDRNKQSVESLNTLSTYDLKRLRELGFSCDQQLTAKETAELFNAMEKVNPLIKEKLGPENYSGFRGKIFLDRNDLRNYEKDLKAEFMKWLEMDGRAEPVKQTLEANVTQELKLRSVVSDWNRFAMCSVVSVVEDLRSRVMLPALCFSDNRRLCEALATRVYEHLVNEEERFIEKPENKKRQVEFEKKASRRDKEMKRRRDDAMKDTKKQRNVPDEECTEKEEVILETSPFSPLELAKFTLKRPGANQELFKKICKKVEFKDGNNRRTKNFLSLLQRGIGYHHSGMTTSQKQAVEILFRDGFLSVVFSTSTLALGIHMPCKTVVFGSDSLYLNPLQFRQMSGRAGRRGFDPKGNAVFLGIGKPKIRRLLMSDITKLRGNIPFTVSYVLRLLTLVSGSDEPALATEAVLTLLENPFLVTFSEEHPDKLKRWMREMFAFSCDVLQDLRLVDSEGNPIGLAGIVNHLSYHEPGNLLFSFFLQKGAIHRLCREHSGMDRLEQLILVLSHLFTKYPLPHALEEFRFANSKVFLEPLPPEFQTLVDEYNSIVAGSFLAALNYAGNESSEERLPFSGFHVGDDERSDVSGELGDHLVRNAAPRQGIQGGIFERSGNKDSEIDLLAHNLVVPLNSHVFYDAQFLPTKEYPIRDHRGGAIKLNSYALDFWRHEIKTALIVDNGLMEGDVYSLLLDFVLVIKSIKVALETIGPESDEVVKTFVELSEEYSRKFGKAYNVRKFSKV